MPLCTVILCGRAPKALNQTFGLSLYRGYLATYGRLDHARVLSPSLPYPSETMDPMCIAPNIEVQGDRVSGCTPWLAQLLVLFFYCRSVTVDRRRQRVLVTTRWFWILQFPQTIPFQSGSPHHLPGAGIAEPLSLPVPVATEYRCVRLGVLSHLDRHQGRRGRQACP